MASASVILTLDRTAHRVRDVMLRDVYEVALHNAEVRRLVYEGEHHRDYPDDWSNTHFIEVRAINELEARRKIEQRYPRDRGFIIEAVTQA